MFRWTVGGSRILLDCRTGLTAYVLANATSFTGGAGWANGSSITGPSTGLPADGAWRLLTFQLTSAADIDLTIGANYLGGGVATGHVAEVLVSTATRDTALEASVMAAYGLS